MKIIGSGESKLETIISYLLIIGVISSLLLELVGMVLFYISYSNLSINQDSSYFIHGVNFFVFVFNQFKISTAETLPVRLMTIGIMFLLLTPFLRVIFSAIYFALNKNIKYALITLFVLAVLVISLSLH
jgi:uncharacterized membrane protein